MCYIFVQMKNVCIIIRFTKTKQINNFCFKNIIQYFIFLYINIYNKKNLNLFSFNQMQQTSQVFDSIFATKKEI